MATTPQPAKVSYFFDKGYKDVLATIKGAWSRNMDSVQKNKDNIQDAKLTVDSRVKRTFLIILNVIAIIAMFVFGSLITVGVSAINVAILLIVMAAIYIGFSLVWAADRIFLLRKKIFTACHNCKNPSLIPIYMCPKCGVEHTYLTPSKYGILKRTCTCGEVLPVTFFNGRKELESKCPFCGTVTNARESRPICIPIVGGRSVGKTAFITAFSKEFITNVAPDCGMETDFYSKDKEQIYREIENDYASGSTRMTDRPQDISKASSVSFSFFVKGAQFNPDRLVHVYDIAGEVFTDNNENEMQKQYEYCQGMVLMVDPFAIPSYRFAHESELTPQDIAGIGSADIGTIMDSFLNKLREVTGLSDSKMAQVPLAVVIGKADSANLPSIIGDIGVKNAMANDPEKFKDYYDTQDYLCRKFLNDNGMAGFVNNITLKFKENRFFACSAIGHTRDAGQYRPEGVLAPMQWLFGKADPKMAETWNTITFSKKVPKITE